MVVSGTALPTQVARTQIPTPQLHRLLVNRAVGDCLRHSIRLQAPPFPLRRESTACSETPPGLFTSIGHSLILAAPQSRAITFIAALRRAHSAHHWRLRPSARTATTMRVPIRIPL